MAIKCKWQKWLNDWHYVCQKQEEVIKKDEEKGSWWSKLLCVFSCSEYTDGYEYDKMKDICSCKGKHINNSMWRGPIK